MTQTTLYVGRHSIRPGERVSLDLPLARIYTHTDITMPLQVLHGREAGPRLFVSAAIHGDEINGVEIIRRLLKSPFLKKIRGTLLAIPVVNVYGFVTGKRYLPDRRDLNRSFPGSETGSLTARLAHLFMKEIVVKCTHGIDLHTGANNRSNLPQVRACMDDPDTASLARAFAAPLILNANVRDGSLRQTVKELGLPILVYEGGEPLRFDEMSIRAGVRGILNVMRKINMLPPSSEKNIHPQSLIARRSSWVRAPIGGMLRSKIPLGAKVEARQLLGILGDAFGENEIEIRAPFAGLIIGKSNIPLVNEGDAIYHIADLSKPHTVAPTISQTELDPDTNLVPSPSTSSI